MVSIKFIIKITSCLLTLILWEVLLNQCLWRNLKFKVTSSVNSRPLSSFLEYKMPYTCRVDMKTCYLQFQILHRSIITNKKLKQVNLRDNDLCDLCNNQEDIAHVQYDCQESTNTLIGLERCLSGKITTELHFDKISILLGHVKNEPIINTLILITKYEIYKKKWNKNTVNLAYLMRIFQSQMMSEIYLGTIKNCLPKTLGKWASIFNELHNI